MVVLEGLLALTGRPSRAGRAPPHPKRRRALHDAAADVFAERPLILVLEDVRRAPDATVQLLAYLVERLPEARLLIVLTGRDTEPDRSGHLARQLARLRRPGGVHRIDLAGVETAGVAELFRVSPAVAVAALGSARAAAPRTRGSGPDRLTRRECEVLVLLAQGLGNRQIATKLFITENTAANHVRSILMKTGSANRTQAARYAVEHGLS